MEPKNSPSFECEYHGNPNALPQLPDFLQRARRRLGQESPVQEVQPAVRGDADLAVGGAPARGRHRPAEEGTGAAGQANHRAGGATIGNYSSDPNEAAAQTLSDLKSPDNNVRISAANALAQMPVDNQKQPQIAAALDQLLIDEDASVRLAAVKALSVWATRD